MARNAPPACWRVELYYPWPEWGTVREDIYRSGVIVEHWWHDGQDSILPEAVGEEVLEVLAAPKGKRLAIWSKGS